MVRALVRTAHAGPSLLITAVIVALAVRAGLSAAPAGPCSRSPSSPASCPSAGPTTPSTPPRDALGGRTDKPIVAGEISRRAVVVAAVVALAVAVALCFVDRPGHRRSSTWSCWPPAGRTTPGSRRPSASGLMYVVGFGLIPAFAASTLPGQPWARPWTLVAAALLGLGAHFANVLPDLAADRAASVQGLPQRVAAGPGGNAAVRASRAPAARRRVGPDRAGTARTARAGRAGRPGRGDRARRRRPRSPAAGGRSRPPSRSPRVDVALFVGVGTALVP